MKSNQLSTEMESAGMFRAVAERPLKVERPANSHGIEVKVVRGLGGLATLGKAWASIASAQPGRRFFHLFQWYSSYLENLEKTPDALHFFLFSRSGKPVGVIPLRQTARPVEGIPVQVWETPRHPHIPLCDFIALPEEDSAALVHLLLDTLGYQEVRWDVLHIHNVLEDSFALSAVRAAAQYRTRLWRTGRSMYFPCDSLESALRNTSGHFRRNLRRQQKKLDEKGTVEVVFAQTAAEIELAFEEFLRLEASGWKGERGKASAIRLQPSVVQFYRSLLEGTAQGERCVISMLKLDGIAIAAQFCLVTADTLYMLKIAYDEAFSAEAPGSYLLLETLKYCCASPKLAQLSLVTGPDWAVGRWNPEAHDVWDAYLFNSTTRGYAAYVAKRLRSVVAPVMKSLWTASKRAPSNPGSSPNSVPLAPPTHSR